MEGLDHLRALLTVVTGDERHLALTPVILIPALDTLLVDRCAEVPFVSFAAERNGDIVYEVPRLELERTIGVSKPVLDVEADVVRRFQRYDTIPDLFMSLGLNQTISAVRQVLCTVTDLGADAFAVEVGNFAVARALSSRFSTASI